MKSISPKKLGMGALTFLFATMLVGCEPPGPAQKAGKGLDDAGKDIKNSLDPRGPAQKAGESIDKTINNK
jgi:hypothetical protein